MSNTVSVIVTTYNSASTVEACLQSIQEQSYSDIEIIVVDNHSSDQTEAIAKKFTDKVFTKGPERCAQRNFGVEKATGEYVLIIDSDMELGKSVVESCVKMMDSKKGVGVVIPEESFGEGFWAACKKLERSYYIGIAWMEAARFFKKTIFQEVGGYDEGLVSGEDWDLSQRVQTKGEIGRVDDLIRHNEGRISLLKTVKKKFYYARKFSAYLAKSEHDDTRAQQTSVLGRYKLFFSQPKRLFANPVVGLGMLFMKFCEFFFGGLGLVWGKLNKNETGAKS